MESASRSRFILLSIILSGIALLIGTSFFLPQDNGNILLSEPEGDEFPDARIRWEWERLHDPATGKIPERIRVQELAFARSLPQKGEVSFLKGAGIAAIEWEQRGPANVGGRTRGVAFDVTGEDTIIAGGVSGGVWRSSDGGSSWMLTTSPDQSLGMTSLAQDIRPGKTNTWYYGTGEASSSASGFSVQSLYAGDGIFKSTDNGRSWRHLTSSGSGTPQFFDNSDVVWRVATDPSNQNEDVLYVAEPGTLLRSSDGGETWTKVLKTTGFGKPSSYYSDVAVTRQGVVYAALSSDGATKGIYRSTDGINFTQIIPANFPGRYGRVVIGLIPSNPNSIYFLAETPGTGTIGKNFLGDSAYHSLWKYTYVSGNGSGDGGVWEDRSANLPQFGGSFGDFYSQGSYDLHIAVKPDDEDVVFIGGTNLYRSTDGFTTPDNTDWVGGYKDVVLDINVNRVIEDYTYPNHHPDQHLVFFSPTNPNIMLSGSDGGIHKTLNCLADSITWISLNNGYITSQFYSVAINQTVPGNGMILGGTQDNGTWRNNSSEGNAPWVFTGGGDGGFAAVGGDGAYICVSKQSGRLYRVELDSQGEVTGSTRIDPEGPKYTLYRFINPFVLDPNDTKILYQPVSQRIWLNRDITAVPLGNERPTPIGWDSLEGSLTTVGIITAISVSDQNPSHRLWYGTTDGAIYRIDDPLGDQPFAVDVSPSQAGYVSCIAVDPENGGRAIAVYSNYSIVSLFETTDAGETWHSISGNLEEQPNGSGAGPSCRWVSILHRGGGTIYLVGTSIGLFSTTSLNGDQTVWIHEGIESIGNSVVEAIDVRQSDGFVAIATHGSGVYSGSVGLLGVHNDRQLTTAPVLESVSPNPMRNAGQVNWSFGLEGNRARSVHLDLIDVRGLTVSTLRNGMLQPGAYSDRLSTQGLVPGLYFLRLTVDGEIALQKLTVL